MFSTAHFIWLGAIALGITALFLLLKKFPLNHLTVQRIATVVLVVLKIFHLSLSMKQSPYGGFVINQTQLSFHLCSLMIYSVIIINLITNEKVVKAIKSFMVPCMLIGAAMALLIPTEGVDPSVPRVWQYMLIHGALVFYGLYLMLVERVDLSLKAYINNLKLLLGVTMLAFLMNSVLMEYKTNFLFLREPPMKGLPILNLDNGWGLYFISLAAVACLLLLIVHLPFIIKDIRAKRTATEDKAN